MQNIIMEHFITLFDSGYLPQGLALHRSLVRQNFEFQLWILCIDDKSFNVLNDLKLPNLTPLQLAQFETPHLLHAKKFRSTGEYCWTLTPFSFDFIFSIDPKIFRITYLDADTWFRKSPMEILGYLEKSSKDILITDHGFSPEYDLSDRVGQYCVQFLTVNKTQKSLKIIRNWQSQCLDWCFNRFEEGKFGDQKYLDKWPLYYPETIYVLENYGLTLAPWNASRFSYESSVLYHFHGLKIDYDPINSEYKLIIKNQHYKIPDVTDRNIYIPYLNDLKESIHLIKSNFKVCAI